MHGGLGPGWWTRDHAACSSERVGLPNVTLVRSAGLLFGSYGSRCIHNRRDHRLLCLYAGIPAGKLHDLGVWVSEIVERLGLIPLTLSVLLTTWATAWSS